jgi:hypothetical protein
MSDIIKLAREAGFTFEEDWALCLNEEGRPIAERPALERFAELVAKQEREACAKVCEDGIASIWPYHDDNRGEVGKTVCENLAKAIRARIKEQT